jgi:hypothetical protein
VGSGECRESLEEWWEEVCTLAATADLYVRLKDSASEATLNFGPRGFSEVS